MTNAVKIILLVSMLLVGANSFAQSKRQDKPPIPRKQKANPAPPTLNETLDWLKEKILAAAFYNIESGDERERYFSTYKVESVLFEGCTVSMTNVSTSWWQSDRRVTTTTINTKVALADLDAERITLDQPSGQEVFSVLIATVDNFPKVKFRMLSQDQSGTRLREDPLPQLSVSFSDRDIAQRTIKAFANAIKQCKARSEPF